MSGHASHHWRRARVTINKNALLHNLSKVREYAPASQVMAVIKANAYGHGLLSVADQLTDADMLAVAMPDEAYALRDAGCNKAIIVLHGFSDALELEKFSESNLSAVIHQQAQLQCLLNHKISSPIDCWLKVDTGMHRLGVPVDESGDYFTQLKNCGNVKDVFLMTHLSSADSPEYISNNNQLNNFIKVINNIETDCSMANSAAIMRLPESHFDVVRPGIMLYGSSPFKETTAAELGLEPVMQFESILLAVKPVKAGESIGYGGTYTCDKDMMIGVVAAGYGDGYPRHAENGTPVWVNNRCCNLVGRVSMDSLCIDLSGVEAKEGDRVVLWGKELSVDRVADSSATIAYELLCNAGAAYFAE